jgi:flagellar motor switch protein FliN
MAATPVEILSKFSSMQDSIWPTVSMSLSEATNQMINISTPLTLTTPTSELYSEFAQPHLVVQFSIGGLGDQPQLLLLNQDHFLDFASMAAGAPINEVEDNTLTEIRPALEGLVAGMCMAIGNLRNEGYVGSGLSIRFQILSVPPNFENASDITRVNVQISGDKLSGTLIWLLDTETAAAICGLDTIEDAVSEAQPFAQVQPTAETVQPFQAASVSPSVDNSQSLDLLMDIPLEISVELGRVKKPVRDVVDMSAGSIIEIDKAAGEPVDVLVNGRLVARGEVVVIEDNFGVRITEILSPTERLQRLNEAA